MDGRAPGEDEKEGLEDEEGLLVGVVAVFENDTLLELGALLLPLEELLEAVDFESFLCVGA